ncbi:MAG: hypothetical protein GY722_16035 [bacterium]|nr:hypothetical protein [bacterium]
MKAGRFGVGLLAGALAAVTIGFLFGGEETAAPSTTTTTTTTIAVAPGVEPWFEPGEVLIGSTVLLPRGLNVEDNMAFFDYDIAGLSPSLVASEDLEHLATSAPEHWLLTTASGATVAGFTGPFDSSVRFELPIGESEVVSVALTGWRIAVPFGDSVELPIISGATASTRRGAITIETVLEQTTSTIVQIEFDRGEDPWDVHVNLVPADPRWRSSGRQGGGRQLIWEGDDAPDSVIIEDAGFEMRPVAGELVVFTVEARK